MVVVFHSAARDSLIVERLKFLAKHLNLSLDILQNTNAQNLDIEMKHNRSRVWVCDEKNLQKVQSLLDAQADKHLVLFSQYEDRFKRPKNFKISATMNDHQTCYELGFIVNRLLHGEHAERREHPRSLVNLNVAKTSDFTNYSDFGRAISLSSGGMFLKTQEELPVGKLVNIQIELGSRESVAVSAKVVYTQKPTNIDLEAIFPRGFGMAFCGVDEEDRMRIGEYVFDRLQHIDRIS